MSQAAALPDVIREFERVDPKIVDQARNTLPRSSPTSPVAAAPSAGASHRWRRR
jgi:hypothetical protein